MAESIYTEGPFSLELRTVLTDGLNFVLTTYMNEMLRGTNLNLSGVGNI